MAFQAVESRRYLLGKDGRQFSLHNAIVTKGHELFINFKHHEGTVYVFSGTGTIEFVEGPGQKGKGMKIALKPGTMFSADKQEMFYLAADSRADLCCVSVYVPPLAGLEVRDETGTYPPTPFVGIGTTVFHPLLMKEDLQEERKK